MKNNNQIKRNKKHTGLYLGLGIGLAAIAASTISAVILTGKTNNDKLAGKVEFKAGVGHKFEKSGASLTVDLKKNKQLIEVLPNEQLQFKNSTKLANDFVGWAKSSDFDSQNKIDINKLVKSINVVSPRTSLTAVYTSNINATGEWHTVTFSKGSESKVILTGNTILNVLDGTQFQDLNKPGCQSEAVSSDQKCIGWKDETGTQIEGTRKITSDMVVTPIMSAATIIKFEISAAGGQIISGTESVAVKKGSKFGDVNQPNWYLPKSANKVFVGWTKDESFKTDWKQSDTISGEVSAYAHCITSGTSGYSYVTAVQPDDSSISVTYEGNTEFAVKNGSKWTDYNKPTPKADGKSVNGWEYRERNTERAWSDWKDVSDDTVFSNDYEVEIRPKMGSSITSVVIDNGKTPFIMTMQKTRIYTEVLPAGSDQSVTYELFFDQAGENKITDQTIAEINSTGYITVYNKIFEDERFNNAIYIRATSVANKSVQSGIIGFSVISPIVESDQFWTVDPVSSEWYLLKNVCCDPTQNLPIQLVKYGSTTVYKTYERKSFNLPVYVGDSVTSIPDNFLYGCSSFDKPIIFEVVVETVGSNFMAGCSSFNQELPIAFVTYVQEMKDGCMAGCTSFNNGQPAGANTGIAWNFTSIRSIGDNFMAGCESFNAQMMFTSQNFESIGSGFLKGCSLFNNAGSSNILLLPSSLKNVGDEFMYKCNNYTGTLQLDCAGDIFAHEDASDNLCATSASANIAKVGFKVTGQGTSLFPFNTVEGLNNVYRKVTKEEIEVKSIQVVEQTGKRQFALYDQFTTSDSESGDLEVLVKYNDKGSTEEKEKTITSGFTTDPKVGTYLTTEGDITVKVTYYGAETTYTIHVGDEPATDWTELTSPEAVTAKVDELYKQYLIAFEGQYYPTTAVLSAGTDGKIIVLGEEVIGALVGETTKPIYTTYNNYVENPEKPYYNLSSTLFINSQTASPTEVIAELSCGNSTGFSEKIVGLKGLLPDSTVFHYYQKQATAEDLAVFKVEAVVDGKVELKIEYDEKGLILSYYGVGFKAGLEQKSDFKVVYESSMEKVGFIEQYKTFLENYESHKDYKNASFTDGSTIGGQSVTKLEIEYQDDKANFKLNDGTVYQCANINLNEIIKFADFYANVSSCEVHFAKYDDCVMLNITNNGIQVAKLKFNTESYLTEATYDAYFEPRADFAGVTYSKE